MGEGALQRLNFAYARLPIKNPVVAWAPDS